MLCCPVMAVHVHQSCCCEGNGDAPSAAGAADPNPSVDAAGSPAAGSFSFAPSGATFGSSAFAGATNLTSSFGEASGVAPAGSSPAAAASDEAPGSQDAGMLLSQLYACLPCSSCTTESGSSH